jgi:hypothetical protein
MGKRSRWASELEEGEILTKLEEGEISTKLEEGEISTSCSVDVTPRPPAPLQSLVPQSTSVVPHRKRPSWNEQVEEGEISTSWSIDVTPQPPPPPPPLPLTTLIPQPTAMAVVPHTKRPSWSEEEEERLRTLVEKEGAKQAATARC